MCYLKSAIVLKTKIYMPLDHDHHTQMLEELGIKDDSNSPTFVRVEVLPIDGNIFNHDLNNWKLNIDQQCRPDWFNEFKTEEDVKKELVKFFEQRFILDKTIDEIKEGRYFIGNNAIIKNVRDNAIIEDVRDNAIINNVRDNAIINNVRDNAIIEDVRDNAIINNVRDNAIIEDVRDNAIIKDVRDNAIIEDVRDNAIIKDVRDNAIIKDVWDNAIINNVRDNAIIKDVWDNAIINNVWDNAIINNVWDNAIINNVWNNAIINNVWNNAIINNVWNNAIINISKYSSNNIKNIKQINDMSTVRVLNEKTPVIYVASHNVYKLEVI